MGLYIFQTLHHKHACKNHEKIKPLGHFSELYLYLNKKKRS